MSGEERKRENIFADSNENDINVKMKK